MCATLQAEEEEAFSSPGGEVEAFEEVLGAGVSRREKVYGFGVLF
jgi:hypothetical protein